MELFWSNKKLIIQTHVGFLTIFLSSQLQLIMSVIMIPVFIDEEVVAQVIVDHIKMKRIICSFDCQTNQGKVS